MIDLRLYSTMVISSGRTFLAVWVVLWSLFISLAARKVTPANLAIGSLLRGLKQSEEAAIIRNTGKECFCYTDLQDCQWKAYEPITCQYLRESAGVMENEYQASLSPDALECLSSDSKSGQAFWRSKSGVVIVKTIQHHECKTLRKLLKRYCQHVQHGYSCLGNVLGLYRVRLRSRKMVYFLVTKNIYHQYPDSTPNPIPSIKYDLKGSTIGRRKSGSSLVLKDLDLIDQNEPFAIGPVAKEVLLSALYRDSLLLSSYNLMDYSLLVEVEEPHVSIFRRFLNYLQPISTSRQDKGKLVVLGANGKVYHFGVIDFLQRYGINLLQGLACG